MTPTPPSPSNPVPEEPLAEAGREPLHAAIASARQERRGGISVGTLGVASAASAAAAFTASHLWGSGTVLSAALTPVIVALVSEFLRRPVDRVSATVAPIIPRPTGSSAGPLPPPQPPPGPPTAVEQTGWAPVSWGGEAPRPGWRPRWRLVVATGLLAFAIVVAFYTLPELIVGHSITGAGGSGTFLPGGGHSAPATTTPTTTTAPTQTVTVQVQTTTVTVPATTPTASTPPTATTPTDTTTTPPPTATTPTATTTTAP